MRSCIIYVFIIVFWGNLSAQPSLRTVETGKVIVKINPDIVPAFEKKLQKSDKTFSDTSILITGIHSFDRINRRYRATEMRRIFPDAGEYEAKHRRYGLHLWYEIAIPEDEDPETVAAGYGDDENVQIAEPRYKIRRMNMPAAPLPFAETPNDPDFGKQWNFNNTGQTGGIQGADIRLIEAWERIKSLGIKNNNVIVAVTDGGVHYDHIDLRANMWVNETELNGKKGVDDDENGYVDDIYGYNFVSRTGSVSPDDHGTHVAGIIAAVTNNGNGVSGIAGDPDDGYGIKIMSVQILEGDRGVSSITSAFTYAADNGAVISQNSWGYDNANVYNSSDVTAINYFINEAGRDKDGNPRPGTTMVGGIVIFAAGNDAKDDKWYPAYFDNVLAVAATNHHGKLARYSNFGNWVNISAPGGEMNVSNKTGGIYSTSYHADIENYYEYMQGTSMACPHVSGVAALILSIYGNENYTPEMLRCRLLSSATPLSTFDPANASKMGAGLVNALAALTPNNTLEKINDLTAQTIDAVSCQLDWTFPQTENDDISGFYIVACATEPITETNFDKYAQQPVAVSNVAGNIMKTVISGLHPGTTYYIAVCYSIYPCYTSEMSNVITITTRTNLPPVVSRPLPDITMRDVSKGKALYFGDVFIDEDGDEMTFKISVASAMVASARIVGDSVLITPVFAGKTTITLTADDRNAGKTSTSMLLTVLQNQAPVFNGLFGDTTLIPASVPIVINLAEHTSDAEGDPVTFSVQTSKSGIVNASINGAILTITPRKHGDVKLQISASDIYAARTTETIHITVEQKYAPNKADQLLTYPNPSTDILWYSYQLNEPAQVSIRFVNSMGQIMFQTPVEKQSSGVYYNNVNLSGWGIGTYFVQLISDGKVLDIRKIVKQ